MTTTKKITVLGATGETGIQVVKQALAAKYEVTAIVRNPDKLKGIQKNRLKIVNGDIFSEVNLTTHFKDADAVISCLGFKRNAPSAESHLGSIKAITGAVRAANVPRLVVMSSYYTEISSSQNQGFFLRWFLIPMLKPALLNKREMEKYLETECKDINYTVVRPPGLTNGSLSGKEIKSEDDAYFLKGSPSRMPRADVAKFILDSLPKSELYKKAVAVGL